VKTTSEILYFHDGHLSDLGMAVYVDNQAESGFGQIPDSVISHVEECMECKLAILDITEGLHIHEMERSRNKGKSSRTPIARIFTSRYLKYAAAVILLIGVVWGVVILVNGPQPKDKFSSHSKTGTDGSDTLKLRNRIAEGREKQALAENKPKIKPEISQQNNLSQVPYLEALIHNQTRSAGIGLHSPAETVSRMGDLEWKWDRQNYLLLLTIRNNRDSVIYSLQAESTVLLQARFNPGLYYWLLENDAAIIQAGKFIIK
jgi:hypothetical protein